MSPRLKAMWNTMECKRYNFNGSLGGASETRWECVSHCLKAMWNTLSVQESAREIASVALSAEQERHTKCVSPRLKARWNTRGTLSSARERASVALSAEQERHTKCVSLCLKTMWNTFSVCLFHSAESATKAISLALHSRPSVWHIALRQCGIPTL